jgi:hypothetical protein
MERNGVEYSGEEGIRANSGVENKRIREEENKIH